METPPRAVTPAFRSHALLWALVGLLVLVVLGVGVLAGFQPLLRLDTAISTAVYAGDDRPPWLGWLLDVVTAPGSGAFRFVVFVPALIWLIRWGAYWTAAWVATANVCVGLLTQLFKELVGRARPAFEEGGARLDTLSYPSGHASGIATMVTVGLILAWPRLASAAARRAWLAAGIGVVVVVGFTRMWLGVHYLSDVIGGWAFGVSFTLLSALAFGAMTGGRAALPDRRPA